MTKCQFNNILVISATEKELATVDKLTGIGKSVTGIGIANTILNLEAEINSNRPDLIIQIGICGAVNASLKLTQAVNICTDYIGDVGAFRGDAKSFILFDTTIYSSGLNLDLDLKKVRAITVNSACNPFIDTSNVDTESMEGAAMMAVAHKHNIECLQIRTISNYISSKREDWEIDGALKTLKETMIILQKNLNFGR